MASQQPSNEPQHLNRVLASYMKHILKYTKSNPSHAQNAHAVWKESARYFAQMSKEFSTRLSDKTSSSTTEIRILHTRLSQLAPDGSVAVKALLDLGQRCGIPNDVSNSVLSLLGHDPSSSSPISWVSFVAVLCSRKTASARDAIELCFSIMFSSPEKGHDLETQLSVAKSCEIIDTFGKFDPLLSGASSFVQQQANGLSITQISFSHLWQLCDEYIRTSMPPQSSRSS